MKKPLLRRLFIVFPAGILLTVYSAYNVFLIFRDSILMTPDQTLICALVALMFAIFAAFLFTAGFRADDLWFLMIRRMLFISALLSIFVFKLRMLGPVLDYFNIYKLNTIIYFAAYVMTQVALLVMFIYYAFIRNRLIVSPHATTILSVTAIVLLLCSFALEVVLLFVYHIGLEETPLRTIIIRPVFFFSLVGICLYFMFPPQAIQQNDDAENVPA